MKTAHGKYVDFGTGTLVSLHGKYRTSLTEAERATVRAMGFGWFHWKCNDLRPKMTIASLILDIANNTDRLRHDVNKVHANLATLQRMARKLKTAKP